MKKVLLLLMTMIILYIPKVSALFITVDDIIDLFQINSWTVEDTDELVKNENGFKLHGYNNDYWYDYEITIKDNKFIFNRDLDQLVANTPEEFIEDAIISDEYMTIELVKLIFNFYDEEIPKNIDTNNNEIYGLNITRLNYTYNEEKDPVDAITEYELDLEKLENEALKKFNNDEKIMKITDYKINNNSVNITYTLEGMKLSDSYVCKFEMYKNGTHISFPKYIAKDCKNGVNNFTLDKLDADFTYKIYPVIQRQISFTKGVYELDIPGYNEIEFKIEGDNHKKEPTTPSTTTPSTTTPSTTTSSKTTEETKKQENPNTGETNITTALSTVFGVILIGYLAIYKKNIIKKI